uniref:SJCHGC07321 protein n=1 Tax=Schistosoma japonicum TaxID=6182 RepID=Q5BRU6_SCHJA|nr:SJCHGC07321 protein [Schistosoma japonicum]
MLKQKEDVLLMVKHVRYKKVDGTLYVNSGRVAWRNHNTSETVLRISATILKTLGYSVLVLTRKKKFSSNC